jgi:YD repeat-containing protein
MDYYLDNNGNDTALYINGKMLWVTKYHRNKYGRILKWINYDSSRLEQANGSYMYEKDGSYTIKLDHKPYGIINQYETYNKQNKIVEEFLMDGGRHVFKYDSLNRLSRIEYIPGLDGYDNYVAEYMYNNELLQFKKVIRRMPGPYEYSEEYFYDSKELLVKSERTVTHSYDEKEFYTITYSYTFRK